MPKRLYIGIKPGIGPRFAGQDRFAYKKLENANRDKLKAHGINLLEFDFPENERELAETTAREIEEKTGISMTVGEYNA